METLNRRGQILIESIFALLCIASLLVLFQMMIDHQLKDSQKYRLSKKRKRFSMWKKMKISNQNKLLALSFLAFIAFSMIYSMAKPEEKKQANEKVYADTYIPKGYVLVPIELANIESVSALIDQFGVIDLYAGAPQSAGSIKIASRVKMLRAPLNPELFAVLVPENESASIMKMPGPFWAVVQNRKSFEEKKEAPNKASIQIEYYKGG